MVDSGAVHEQLPDRGRELARSAPGRAVHFEYPDQLDPAWTPAKPEFACAANSISLLMPHMEPYFVRSIAAVLDQLDERLQGPTRWYLAQETRHHRQHKRFNAHLTARYPRLTPIENLAERAYRQLGRTRSLGFNVAFAAASETIAYSAARWSAEHRQELFAGSDPVISSLFLWHLAEEMEHKSVAWDVHRAIGGGPARYLLAAACAMVLVMFFVGSGTTVMLWAERRLFNPVAWIRLTRWAITFAFEVLPNLVMSGLPGHHPDKFTDPLWLEVWLREHDGR